MDKLYNLHDYSNPIDSSKIFGNDTKKLFEACKKVMHNALYPYEGVYFSPEKPKLHDEFIKCNRNLEDSVKNYRLSLEAWKLENPDEVMKEKNSREDWEKKRDKQFRIIYGIAKRHHVYLDWCGKKGSVCCCPDQWMIYKGGKSFAMIKL